MHVVNFQIAVEVGKKRASAGRFPFERFAQGIGVGCDQEQILFVSKMFGRSLSSLLCR